MAFRKERCYGRHGHAEEGLLDGEGIDTVFNLWKRLSTGRRLILFLRETECELSAGLMWAQPKTSYSVVQQGEATAKKPFLNLLVRGTERPVSASQKGGGQATSLALDSLNGADSREAVSLLWDSPGRVSSPGNSVCSRTGDQEGGLSLVTAQGTQGRDDDGSTPNMNIMSQKHTTACQPQGDFTRHMWECVALGWLCAYDGRTRRIAAASSSQSERVLERRVRQIVEPRIQEEQCGFRPGRGTVDQLYTLCRILEGAWEFAQPVHMCFVDLEKAFDHVPRGVLWGVLREYGVSDPLIRAVRSLYDRCQSLVRIAGNKSDLFPVGVGLRQGCPLSPILFIIFMDRISRHSQGVEGVRFGDLRIGSLLFADDVVLMASSDRDLQLSLDRFAAECEAVGMRISTSKSESMVLNRKRVECTLRVGDEILPQVEEFKYLGVLFTSEGRMEREIDRRIGAASAVMRTLHGSVVVKRELSRKAKLSIYQSIFVPALTYGHELWVMTERTRSRVQAAEMSFLRRVAGLSLRDRVRSSVIREELGVDPLLLHVERSQMRWLGHLVRMPPGRLPGGPGGRPRTRWRDYVSRLAWERLGIPQEELAEVAGEREVWASLLRLLPPRPDPG
ncbi:LINE-1 reverse transcriptase [Merluccius polli]|uniref:LINE-1 reverse transcriptase n=1 Tax=Merluccius polli TaxID=89951 RepID=A0AA47M344_MERPO|nr:LINE-1 reverse transcriptase [Merluccius polli]